MNPDKDRLRGWLEELERIDRPSASEGERRAAEWLVGRFGELGAEARIEAEPAHGTYWWPLGTRGRAGGARGDSRAARAAVARWRPCRCGGGRHGLRLPARQTLVAPPAPPPHHLQRPLRARTGRRRTHRRRHRPPRRCPLGPRLPSQTAQPRRPSGNDRAHRHEPAADGAGARRAGTRGARRLHRQARCSPSSASCSDSARPRRWPRSACAMSCPVPTTTAARSSRCSPSPSSWSSGRRRTCA